MRNGGEQAHPLRIVYFFGEDSVEAITVDLGGCWPVTGPDEAGEGGLHLYHARRARSSATQAYGINASGQIVGSYESGGPYYPGTQDSPTSPEPQRRDPVAGAAGLVRIFHAGVISRPPPERSRLHHAQ